MAKTFSEWIATLSAVTGLGAGDKVPVVEGGVTKYVEGDDFGGGITALTGDVTASGTGSVAATIANLAVTNAKVATGIDAVKIADGSVTNAEFQYLGGVTSDLQTQINAKQASDATLTAFAALTIAADSLTIGTGADAFSQTSFAANTFPAKASTGSLEAKTITDFGLSLVNDADATAGRTTLGLGTLATQSGTFSGTSSGTNTGDQDLSGLQPIDSDLTTIAGLTPSNDDFLQRKAGAWVNRTVAQVKTDLGVPTYARYVALLSQSGTDAPVATVLENTLGGTVVWTRDDVGIYVGTLAGVFADTKTWCSATGDGDSALNCAMVRTSGDTVGLYTQLADGSIGDIFSIVSIEIRVYP